MSVSRSSSVISRRQLNPELSPVKAHYSSPSYQLSLQKGALALQKVGRVDTMSSAHFTVLSLIMSRLRRGRRSPL